jgi:hypothetical protein
LTTPPLPPSPQFDRERIPERVVHARGASAKGFFETTHDISHLSCADLFRAPGVQTPVIARFSTALKAPAVQKHLAELQLEPIGRCGADFATYLGKQNVVIDQIIREAGIREE